MRFPLISSALAAICLALPAAAQKMNGMSFSSPRHATTLAMFSADFSVGHMATITHGQPIWKPEYTDMLDKLKGKTNRLGKDWWTTLMTSTTIELGGVKIPAGSYCIGLHCDKEGKFSLALATAAKAMKAAKMPWQGDWQPDHIVPLKLHKDIAKDDEAKKMVMTLASVEGEAGKGTYTLAWGPHKLTTTAQLHMEEK